MKKVNYCYEKKYMMVSYMYLSILNDFYAQFYINLRYVMMIFL